MNTLDTVAMGDSFSEWQRLTDAYAKGIDELASRRPGAAQEAMRVSRALQTCSGAVDQARKQFNSF